MEENNNLNIDSESKTIKFKKKRTLFLAGGFILLIIITIFLLFFKNDLFKKEVNKNNNDVKEEDKEELKDNEELLIESLLEEKLPFRWTTDVNSKLYSDKLVKFDDLDQLGVIDIIVGNSDEASSPTLEDLNINENDLNGILGDYVAGYIKSASLIISMDKVVSFMKEQYNYDNYNIDNYNEIEKIDKYIKFTFTGATAYLYNNNIFIYYNRGAQISNKKTVSYTYEIIGNELYIYEKMFIIEYNYYYSKTTCYANQYDSLVTKTFEYDEQGIYPSEEYENTALDLCSPYAKTYKHVFKLNDSGEYYWYSTEPYEA